MPDFSGSKVGKWKWKRISRIRVTFRRVRFMLGRRAWAPPRVPWSNLGRSTESVPEFQTNKPLSP